jgi:hypothetical protein
MPFGAELAFENLAGTSAARGSQETAGFNQ